MPLRPSQGHRPDGADAPIDQERPVASLRRFHCRIDVRPEAMTLRAAGTLGIDAAHELDADLRAVRDLGFRDVVLDLREIHVIAPAGVALILRWITSASLHGRRFRVLLGPTVDEAVAALFDGGVRRDAEWAA